MKTVSNYQIAKQALKNASIEYKRFIYFYFLFGEKNSIRK